METVCLQEMETSSIRFYQLKGRCIVDKNSDPSFANVVSTTTIFRIVVFLDTQCNGGSPTIDGILWYPISKPRCIRLLQFIAQYRQIQDTPRQRVTVQPGPCFMDNTPTPDTVACPGGEAGSPSISKTSESYHVLRRIWLYPISTNQ